MSQALESLSRHFGFREFLPGQRDVIEHLLAGRSAAAVFPTGGGKSLCYQLPALALPGLTVVVSPLIALMKDQLDRLTARGIAAARVDSSLSAEETAETMQRVRDGSLRLLYAAPERFNNERFREAVERVRVSLFAVDEAHCISEWGHNFRPDYLKLAEFARRCRAERMLALTATATPAVLADICRGFAIEPQCAVRTGFYRPNLTLRFTPTSVTERDAALIAKLRKRIPGPTIVYVTLQRTAEDVARRLCGAGFDARAYHAGMESDERTTVQDWFLASDCGIVVATIAFGMGIDKPNIRYVDHYNLPKSLENLSQEIGRAGRDGLPSVCEIYVCPDDLNALENFALGDTPAAADVESLVRSLFALGDDFDVSLYELSAEHDIRQLVVRTLLVYLELDGYLEERTPFYSQYRFQPLASSADILARFQGERREFLASLFRRAVKAKTWFTLDVEAAAEALGSPRDRVVRALDYLAEQRLIDLKAEGVRNRFKQLKTPADLRAVAADLHRRLVEREQRELSRLNEVLELAGHDGCQTANLCQHFGETRTAPCGHCTHCLDGSAARLLPRPVGAIDSNMPARIASLRREVPGAFDDARRLARFLCGLTSPKLSKLRLGGHALFGSLPGVPMAEVLKFAEMCGKTSG